MRKFTLSFLIGLALDVNVLMLFSSEMMVEKEYACVFVIGKLSQPSLIFFKLGKRVREWRIIPQLQIGYV